MVYLADETPPVTYIWNIICYEEHTSFRTKTPSLKFTFAIPTCTVIVYIIPAIGEALHVEEQVEMFPDFTIWKFEGFQFRKGTIAVIQIHGNFSSRNMTFVWNFENAVLPTQTTSEPQFITVFNQVGTFKLHTKISNPAKTMSTTFSVTIFAVVQGEFNLLFKFQI